MMFNRISFKRLLAFFAVLIMAVSFSLTAFAADDDDENKEPAGTPIINVISGNVYEIVGEERGGEGPRTGNKHCFKGKKYKYQCCKIRCSYTNG